MTEENRSLGPPAVALTQDLWVALGHDVLEFPDAVNQSDLATVWARLIYEARTLNALFGPPEWQEAR